jgi:cation transport regulator
MPYKTNADLPDAIKNSLPGAAQGIWREAYNGAEKANPGTENEEKRAQIAWGAVKNAGYQKGADGNWVKKNTSVIRTHDFDVEVFSVGEWNGDPYTEKDLDAMVNAFGALRDTVKPPVKMGHDDKQKISDGMPSLGWVTSLRRAGAKLIARLSEVPDIVYKAIRAGRYKRVSSEIFWNYKDATGKVHPRVLAGVALLGADIPAVTNLKDLEAFLTQNIQDGSFEKIATYAFDWGTENHIQNPNRRVVEMEEKERKDFEAKIAAETKEKDAAKAEVKRLKDEKAARDKKEADDKKASRVDEIKTFCETSVKDGKMTPAFRDKLLKDIEDGKMLYSHEAGFGPFVETFKLFIEKGGVMKLDEEYSLDTDKEKYSDPGEEVVKRAKKYMADHPKVGYEEASDAVLEADPELMKAYSAS